MSDISPRDIASVMSDRSASEIDPLGRALAALSRDSDQRRQYLRERWQGAFKELSSGSEPLSSETDLEKWWSRRLKTPLGRALSQLGNR